MLTDHTDMGLHEVSGPPAVPGVPSSATALRAGPWQAAVWTPEGRGLANPGVRLAVHGPAGRGEAFLAAQPNALAMQMGGVRVVVGDQEALLRRNGPRLRRKDRVVTIEADTVRWRMTFPRGGAQVTRDADGEVLWRREGDARTGTPTMSPDEAALVLLLDRTQIEATVAGPLRVIRYL